MSGIFPVCVGSGQYYLSEDDALGVAPNGHQEVKPGPDLVVVLHGGKDYAEVVNVGDVLLLLSLNTQTSFIFCLSYRINIHQIYNIKVIHFSQE